MPPAVNFNDARSAAPTPRAAERVCARAVPGSGGRRIAGAHAGRIERLGPDLS